MSVGRNSVAGQVLSLSDSERMLCFITMTTLLALLDKGVDAIVDDSCEDANMH